jgi:membrane-anchored protein YejM (alkaline phosphatase superfamily)
MKVIGTIVIILVMVAYSAWGMVKLAVTQAQKKMPRRSGAV